MTPERRPRFEVRCEWGEEGLAALLPESDVVIVVDVLSFSTSVDIAVARGVAVFPYYWKDETARDFAQKVGAELAGTRSAGGLSLSPASLVALEPGTRLVLPSPNGSTLSLSTQGRPTYAACLRNAEAVARAALRRGERIAVIAAGERWHGGALRPSLEDWLGAGAVIEFLGDPGAASPTAGRQRRGSPQGTLSPEAEAARAAFRALRFRSAEALHACRSGRELIDRGYARDVALAAELLVSEAVPCLVDGAYTDERGILGARRSGPAGHAGPA